MTNPIKKIRDDKKRFEAGHLSLSRYAKTLARSAMRKQWIASEIPVLQSEWPQLARVLQMAALESKITKPSRLSALSEGGHWTNFLWHPEEHWKARGYLRWYFEKMADEFRARGIKMASSGAFADWTGYWVLRDEISAPDLIEEISRLENLVFGRWNLRPEVKQFIRLEDDYIKIKELLRLEISRQELKRLEQKKINLKSLAKECFSLYTKTFGGSPEENIRLLHKRTSIFEIACDYYSWAERRDETLSGNFLSQIKEAHPQKAVLVAGGFHIEAVAAFLREKEMSYAVVTPKIKNPGRKLNYRARIHPGLKNNTPLVFARSEQLAPPVTGASLGEPEAEPSIQALLQAVTEISKGFSNGLSLGTNGLYAGQFLGDPVDGKYPFRITGKVGNGGQAEIWLAEDYREAPAGPRQVLLKIALSRQYVRILRCEARYLGRVGRHSNIIAMSDLYEGSGYPILVLEPSIGMPMNHWLEEQQEPKEGKEAVSIERMIRNIFIPVAQALHYAHEKGVIHRDVKLQNILIRENPQTGEEAPLLIDFGMAVDRQIPSRPFSGEGRAIRGGTPLYNSPEEILDTPEIYLPTNDIWNFGILLYRAATGSVPFLSDNPAELDRMITFEPLMRPALRAAMNGRNMPADLEDLIVRMLDKHARSRPQNMLEVIQALEQVRWNVPAQVSEEEMQAARKSNPDSRADPRFKALLAQGVEKTKTRVVAKHPRHHITYLSFSILFSVLVTLMHLNSSQAESVISRLSGLFFSSLPVLLVLLEMIQNNRGIKNIRSQPVWRTPPTASLESLEEENTPTASSLGMTDEEYERWRAKEFGRQPDFGGGEEFESDEEILPDQSGFFSDADNALFVLVDDSVEEDAELEAKLQKLTAKVENQVREQKWVEARETLLEICRLTPNNESELGPLYYIYKGRILLGQEAWVPALQNFAKASRLIHKEKEYENRESELAGILFCQIRAYYALGDYKLLEEKTSEALEAPYASAFNRQAKFIIRRLRGVARLFLHKYGEAKDDFSTLIQSARNELIPTELEKAYIGLIFANRKLELTSAEEEAFHEALQLATETPLLSIYGAIKSYEEKNWQAVHEALGNAEIAALVMQRPWDLFMVDYVYAELFHALGEDTLAIGLLVVMRLADPLYLPALSLLSRIYWRLGSREQAHSFFRGAEFIKNPQPNALTFAEFQEKMGADSTSLALFSPEVLAYFFRESRAGVISYSWWGERWMKALSRVHNLEARIHYARIALEQCPDFSPIMQVIEKISGTDPLNPQAESLGEPSREAQEFVIDASGGIIGLGRTNTKVTVTEVTVTKVTVTLLGMLSMSENSSQRISIMA